MLISVNRTMGVLEVEPTEWDGWLQLDLLSHESGAEARLECDIEVPSLTPYSTQLLEGGYTLVTFIIMASDLLATGKGQWVFRINTATKRGAGLWAEAHIMFRGSEDNPRWFLSVGGRGSGNVVQIAFNLDTEIAKKDLPPPRTRFEREKPL